jgi:hypothetical protein
MDENLSSADQPVPANKSKRRWLQFSLRSLLIFTLSCAVAGGWLGKRMEQKRDEREAIEALVKLGCYVEYDYETENANAKPPGPDWLRNLLGENFLSEVVCVSIGRPPTLSASGLVNLKGMTQLQTLDLNGSKVTDAGLTHLIALPRLDFLSLANTAVSDSGLAHVSGLPRLQTLNLIGTHVTDAGLAPLYRLTKLQMLELHGTNVTDAGVDELQKSLPNCKIIR